MKVTVYFEGASTGRGSKKSQIEARTSFQEFARKKGLKRMPRFIPCGDRRSAYEDFCTAVQTAREGEYIILLVDSEAPVVSSKLRWQHLKDRPGDDWSKPDGVSEEQVHLMVECMETWLIADRDALKKFYHNDNFLPNNISNRSNLEELSKAEVYNNLKAATKQCRRMKPYDKGQHSWKILKRASPSIVQEKCPHAKIFFEVLEKKCEL